MYDNEEACTYCVPNEIKTSNMEWNNFANSSHPFANDIQNADMVYVIEDINHSDEQYGFFFFKKWVSDSNNIAYKLEKVVLDECLEQGFIRHIVNMLICVLFNGGRLPTSRIILSPDINYQLSAQQLQDTSNKVADVIILKFTDERDGIWNNDKNKERLKRMVMKNKNQPL